MSLEEEKGENYTYDLAGEITFHNVSLEIAGKQIFSNLNFAITQGEKIAIVGENGSGKSTLAKAILGFYPITRKHLSKLSQYQKLRQQQYTKTGRLHPRRNRLIHRYTIRKHRTRKRIHKRTNNKSSKRSRNL